MANIERWTKVREEAEREPTLADYLIDPPTNDYWQGYNAGVEVVWARVEQLRGAVGRAEEAEALLRRLYEWDHMQTAGDGPYWKREIDSLLGGR